jgi:hypothetical protein
MQNMKYIHSYSFFLMWNKIARLIIVLNSITHMFLSVLRASLSKILYFILGFDLRVVVVSYLGSILRLKMALEGHLFTYKRAKYIKWAVK